MPSSGFHIGLHGVLPSPTPRPARPLLDYTQLRCADSMTSGLCVCVHVCVSRTQVCSARPQVRVQSDLRCMQLSPRCTCSRDPGMRTPGPGSTCSPVAGVRQLDVDTSCVPSSSGEAPFLLPSQMARHGAHLIQNLPLRAWPMSLCRLLDLLASGEDSGTCSLVPGCFTLREPPGFSARCCPEIPPGVGVFHH